MRELLVIWVIGVLSSRSHLISGLGFGGYSKASGFVKMVPLCKISHFQ